MSAIQRGLPWSYAAASSGIANTTTAVTIKAADSERRHRVHSMQVSADTLGAVTELAIRAGAGGTVLWRGKLQTGPTPLTNIVFEQPLEAGKNTLLEVVTLSAVTGGVYVSAQGDSY